MTKFEQYLEEEAANKKRYKGVYNWHGENHTVYTYAPSKEKAHLNMCNQLAKKLNTSVMRIVVEYKNKSHNIEEVRI